MTARTGPQGWPMLLGAAVGVWYGVHLGRRVYGRGAPRRH